MSSKQIRWRDVRWWVLVAYAGVVVLAAAAALWPDWGFTCGVVAITGVNLAYRKYSYR